MRTVARYIIVERNDDVRICSTPDVLPRSLPVILARIDNNKAIEFLVQRTHLFLYALLEKMGWRRDTEKERGSQYVVGLRAAKQIFHKARRSVRRMPDTIVRSIFSLPYSRSRAEIENQRFPATLLFTKYRADIISRPQYLTTVSARDKRQTNTIFRNEKNARDAEQVWPKSAHLYSRIFFFPSK